MNVLERDKLRKIIELTRGAWNRGGTSTDVAIELGKRVIGIRILALEALALETTSMAVDAHDDVKPGSRASGAAFIADLDAHYRNR